MFESIWAKWAALWLHALLWSASKAALLQAYINHHIGEGLKEAPHQTVLGLLRAYATIAFCDRPYPAVNALIMHTGDVKHLFPTTFHGPRDVHKYMKLSY